MGLIDEITGLMRKGPEAVGRLDSIKINTKSVARGAKDSTFQFPVLISDSAPIDMANTMARTLDQVYASFTQTWLSEGLRWIISFIYEPRKNSRNPFQCS